MGADGDKGRWMGEESGITKVGDRLKEEVKGRRRGRTEGMAEK